MKCPVCNQDATAGSQFCSHCGAKMLSADKRPAPSAETETVGALGARRRVDVPEELLWEGQFSPKGILGSVIAAAAGSALTVVAVFALRDQPWAPPAGALALAAMWLAVAWRLLTRRLGVHYKLTNQMFYHQTGVITRRTDRIEVIDIDDVTYVQGLLDRAVDVGNIEISSSDHTNPSFWLYGVEKPEAVAHMIDKARRAERIRRGVSVDSLSAGTQHSGEVGAN